MNIFVNSHPDPNLDDEKELQDSKSFPIKRSRAECSVDRSLALTLYVSRFFGVAPVSFKKKRNSIFVSVSPAMYAFSCFLLLALHASIISGLVLDLNVASHRTVRVRSATSSLAWLTELVVVTVLITFAVYYGPKRVNLNVVCLYLCFYLEFMATFPLELQFMDIVMKIVSAQKAINNALAEFVCQIDSREKYNVKVVNFDYLLDKANVDEADNSSKNTTKYVKESASQISKKDTKLFRYLIVSYGAICDVVRQINDSNAILLVVLLLSFFLHLIVSPYYLISFWVSTKHWVVSAKLQIGMCIFHTFNMMIIIEPAHRCTEEMENTKILLSQLTRRVTRPGEPLFHELDLFHKQIVLNAASFTPMGICSLKRSIITTIFGGVTTYLVIILQFRALDQQNW
ncbi:uncharacterized protein LOC113240106 [Hyposmocoma kahamanoa]|uniref:uncharacterized protein LOC113240106 n=1 Tax=Hyposmocoma kahamanoa TaxID=1477025 RepID=UPI000E6D8188|nr:uncharacterized protein LOC113240106 [Hyposmocoma kahamanoa]